MWPLGIIFPDEVIEAGLLLEAIGARGPDGFFLEGEVHALMAPVLLRAAWFDALDVDAETEPPDGELGEIEEGVWASEGYSVVGSYCIGKTVLAKEALEGSNGEVFAGGFEGLAQEQVSRGVIGDGEGIAIAPVTELELAFEVGAPQFVGC